MRLRRVSATSCFVVAASTLGACGTTRSHHYWGETATITPDGATVARAARNAALDPWTWVPLAGAAALSISDWDEDLSDWARDETPIFGSQEDAEDASDDLRAWARDAWMLSMLATPSGEELDVWARNKLQGYLVEWAGTFAAGELTEGLKSAFERERPDSSDRRSMPSGHATSASASAALAWRNVDAIEMPEPLRWTLGAGLVTIAAGCGWARVEAGKHYPTDVLVGSALGNFVARFVHDTFLGPSGPLQVTAFADPATGSWTIGVAMSW